MGDVFIAQFLRGVVRLGIIVAIRHPEPSLHRLRNYFGAVLVVLAGTEIKEHADAERVQVRDLVEQVVAILDRLDLLQFVGQRLGSLRLNRLFIHPATVIVADQLHVRRQPPGVFDAFSAIPCRASLLCSIN